MPVDIYSGAVDWNRIYRCFHSPADIASRIEAYFVSPNSPILFAGFPEVAAILCESGHSIQFIEFSAPIAQIAKCEFSELSVQTGDILQVLEHDRSIDVAIVCRISAYWQSTEDLQLLVNSLARFPRRLILIDFYDRDLVSPGKRVEFSNNNGYGYWNFLSFENVTETMPTIAIAEMDVEYSSGDLNLKYIASRAFFKKGELLRFFKSHFPNANVRSAEPLIVDDPSFSVVIDFSGSL